MSGTIGLFGRPFSCLVLVCFSMRLFVRSVTTLDLTGSDTCEHVLHQSGPIVLVTDSFVFL